MGGPGASAPPLPHPDIRVPVPETAVVDRLFFGQDEVGEAEHGRHIFFVAIVMPRDSNQVAGLFSFSAQAYQNQVAEVVISMEQEAVIPIAPVFPWKAANILGADRKDLTAVLVVKGTDFRIASL